jgi:hypothetical protein
MEVEVSALMGAADKALWRSAGLFTSADELTHCARLKSSRKTDLGLISTLGTTKLFALASNDSIAAPANSVEEPHVG